MLAGFGYGKGYKYAHDFENAVVEQEHLPEALRGRVYYQPTDRGLEREFRARMAARRAQPERPADPPAGSDAPA
jgi:putative ATPase